MVTAPLGSPWWGPVDVAEEASGSEPDGHEETGQHEPELEPTHAGVTRRQGPTRWTQRDRRSVRRPNTASHLALPSDDVDRPHGDDLEDRPADDSDDRRQVQHATVGPNGTCVQDADERRNKDLADVKGGSHDLVAPLGVDKKQAD